MKILKRIKLMYLSILILTLLQGCKKEKEEYLFSHKTTNTYYKIVYENDTILYITISKNNKKKEIDTTLLYKKSNKYYHYKNDLFSDFDERIWLSTKKDTFYNYNIRNSFYCRISKIGENKFRTTYANYDSLTYKYRHSIYYDNNYNIYKIETVNNKVKSVFTKQ
ncbi:hypothetical protein [Flavobacterium croceum]|nr:hypothetical protein [Flavobacterium croceum]